MYKFILDLILSGDRKILSCCQMGPVSRLTLVSPKESFGQTIRV